MAGTSASSQSLTPDPDVGLCSVCHHVRRVRSDRGSLFYASAPALIRAWPPTRAYPCFNVPASRAIRIKGRLLRRSLNDYSSLTGRDGRH